MKTNNMNTLPTTLVAALLTVICAANSGAAPVAVWHFEPEPGGRSTDSVSKAPDTLHGPARYHAQGVRGQCLKLDGFANRVERAADKAPRLSGAFSIEAWVALQEYPWNWTGIVDRQEGKQAGFFFGLDYQGALGMSVAAGDKWIECLNSAKDYNSIFHTDGWEAGALHAMVRSDRRVQVSFNGLGDIESEQRLPSGEWCHVAIVLSNAGKFARLYVNGKLGGAQVLRQPVKLALKAGQIGGWNGGGRNFDGCLDDFRIYGRALNETDLAQVAAGAGPTGPLAWWKFDEPAGAVAKDTAGAHDGEIQGGALVAGKLGTALELNGTDGCVRIGNLGALDEVTLTVWARPLIPDKMLPLHVWNQVVGTYDPATGIALYLNGEMVGSKAATGPVKEPTATSLLIGGSHEQLAPVLTERGPSMMGSPMLLSGLLDEVGIHDTALTPEEVQRAFKSVRPPVAKPLDDELMPTGPLGKGEFGASMEDLKYGESWDGNYRMRGPGDVVVKFDEFPFNYVFWHGWSYGQCMVSENGLLMADQSVERANENGCTEHMSDKQNRYCHISIVENNDARVVLHWRYNPCDIFYQETNVDPKTGWGDWVDEYFHIYPDGVMLREQKFWTTGEVERKSVGGFGGWPSNQETIFFNQPGKGPLDTVDIAALTVANDAGESRTFAWQPEFPWGIGREPAKPTIQMVNFKATFRPYMLRRPGATITAFPPSGYIDRNFPYWNHWPVSQLPNDGRKGTRTDRPAHTSLAWFCEPPVRTDGILFTWIYMYGLTAGQATDLVPLSKSWNSPAELTLTGEGFASSGYDLCQRAYLLAASSPGKPGKLELTLAGSANSPVLNPAIVVRGWGDSLPVVTVNGKPVPRGSNCRVGFNHELEGTDLVLWLKHEATSPVAITLTKK
ncbi:MAG: LamG domain-containing protein [Verrucomicrobia bacterium]|nr:LamG domain-containing protein [Verrucomicrobiota bacterium]